jgi:uncharacterized membrane protein
MTALVPAAASLVSVAISALAAGVGISAVFSLAILGTARYTDARRADQNVVAIIYGLLALVAFLACAAAVAYGVVLINRKS